MGLRTRKKWPPGLHKMTREKPKRALWVGHGLEPRPQFNEETPQKEREERTKFAAEQEKKKKTRN